MQVIKRSASDIPKESAHGGSGFRKVYASQNQLKSTHFDAVTHGYLPAGGIFDWHDHQDTEEVMIVVKGQGVVSDADGDYGYTKGDVFVFPANIQHKISNTSNEEHEMIFIRVKI
jgi:quercetin dioxygenase-like cupin family protein